MKAASRIFLAASIAAFLPVTGLANGFNWDPTLTGGGLGGGTGTWNTAGTANWWLNGGGDSQWTDTTGVDQALFGGTSGTVTISGGVTANALVFNTSGYTLSSGTITLAGSSPAIAVVNSGNTATISSVIAGSVGITAGGAGTLTLSGTNTFTGQLTISSGTTVKAGSAGALGAGGTGNETVVSSGGTLDVNGQALTATETVEIAGTGVGGNGALVNTGGSQINALNAVVLTADASVGGTGRFDIRSGTSPTLNLNGHTLTKVGTNDFHVVSGTITAGSINVTAGEFALEGSTVVDTSGGTITFGAGTTFGVYGNASGAVNRNIVSNGATIANLGLAATINSAISLNSGTTTLSSSSGGQTTLAGSFSGSGALTKAGSDTYTLSGANTYSGATALNAGRLNLTSTNASSITVASGATLGTGGTGSTTGSLTLNAGANLALPGGSTMTGFAANSVTVSGAVNVSFDATGVAGANYTVLNYGSGFSGAISNFSVTTGHGVFSNSGSAIQLFYQGAAYDTWNTTSGTWNTTATNWINGVGDSKFASGDTAVFNDRGTASTVTVSGTVTPAAIVVNNTSSAYTFAGTAISGSGSLTKNGTGTLALFVQETYTGNTIVNGGILDLTGGGGSTGVIRGTANVNTGGTLQLSTGDAVGFSGGASALTVINLVGGTLNINTISNQTLGSATINMTGGTLTGLSGANLDFFGGGSALNTFASNTTSVISGTKISPIRQGATTFTVAQGSTASGIDLDITSILQGSNTGVQFVKAGAGTMRLDAANTVTASAMAVNGGTLILAFSPTVTSNILPSSNGLSLAGGTLSLTNTSGGAVTQTFTGLTSQGNAGSRILLANTNETLNLTGTLIAGGGSAVNFNTSAGGADASSSAIGTDIVTLAGQTPGSVINVGYTVTDSTGFGLATVDSSNRVVRLTSFTLLPASGALSGTNFRIDNNNGGATGAGSSSLIVTASESAATITVDTTTASGTLTLNSGVILTNAIWNFGAAGASGTNTYTITGGAGLTSVFTGGLLNFNNYNAGLVTIATPILDNSGNAVNFGGTGTTLVSGANTYTGLTTIGSGTVQLGSATALGTTAAGTTVGSGATLDLNGQTVAGEPLTLNGTLINSSATAASFSGTVSLASALATMGGTGNFTLSGLISGSGALFKAGAGTVTLSNAGSTFTGNITVNAGTLATSGSGAGTDSMLGLDSSSRTITINSGATLFFGNNNTFGGGGTALANLPSIVNLGGTLKSANYNILGNVTLGNGATMTSTLPATSSYTAFEFKGGSTVTVSNTGGNTSPSSIATSGVNLGGLITFNVGSVTGTSTPDLTISAVVNNASPDNGSAVGYLVKNGAGTLALTAANTYTGSTTVNAGALFVNGTLGGTTGVSVAPGATLGGSGTITPGGTTSVTLTAGSTLAPGGAFGAVGKLTINSGTTPAASVLSLASGANFTFDLNTGLSSDTLALINGSAGDFSFGGNAINFDDLTTGHLSAGTYTLFTADVAGAYSSLTTDGRGDITSGLTIGTGLSAYPGSVLMESGNNIVLQIVPEPGSAVSLLSGLGMLLGLSRRRRRTRSY